MSDGVDGDPILAGDGNVYDRIDPENSGSFGFSFGVLAGENAEFGFIYGRQESTLLIGGTQDREIGDLPITTYHGYFGYNFGAADSVVRPFVFGGLGATKFESVEVSVAGQNHNLGGATQFSTTWGGGVKIFLAPHFGIRVAGRGRLPISRPTRPAGGAIHTGGATSLAMPSTPISWNSRAASPFASDALRASMTCASQEGRERRMRRPTLPRLAAIALILLGRGAVVQAQPKTDVVSLANGDRITGEVKRLQRGQLELSTDDEGTIYFEWDKVIALEARRVFEVETTDGLRYLGTLGAAGRRSIVITGLMGAVTLTTTQVTLITPIGQSFWKKLDGSVDAGFSYTHSSKITQLNINSTTVFRKAAFEARLTASGTLVESEDNERDDRGILQASYLRFRGKRLVVSAAAGFENNESLGIRLRSQLGVAIGPRLVNTNRAQLSVGAGLAVNDERGVDTEPTQNIEGILLFRTSYYSYDRPRTNVDVSFQYFPSLTDIGRRRIQLDAALKREVWKDLFVALNVFDTFDSRPPNPDSESNDVGVVLSLGWSY